MFDVHKNFAYSTVATAPSPPSSGTSLVVASGEGTKFPTVPFNATIWPSGVQPTSANAEIVRVTKRATDTLTIVRAQEGSTARTVIVGDQIAAMITAKTAEDIERTMDVPMKVGSLTAIGHSYIAGSTQVDSGTPNVYQESCVSRLMALLGITDDNVIHMGQAAAALVAATNPVTSLALSGWSGVYQMVWPNNAKAVNAAGDVVVSDPLVGPTGAFIIVHGINDLHIGHNSVVADNDKRAALANVASKHAYRASISRCRAGVVYGSIKVPSATPGAAPTITWDSTISVTGTWTDFDSVLSGSGAALRQSSDFTTPATFTITIPEHFTGGVVVISLLSQENGVGHLTAGYAASGAITVTMDASTQFPNTGQLMIKNERTGEEMLVTAGLGTTSWTVTSANRGLNGTTAAAGLTDDIISIPTDTHDITWSGTVFSAGSNPAHPDTQLGGQGNNNRRVPIAVRFLCTAADAGKTIIGTLGGFHDADDVSSSVGFDSWWIEAPNPPPLVVTNLIDWPEAAPVVSMYSYIGAWNTMIDAVVAEFDGYVKVADVYTEWWKRNGDLNSTLNNTDVTSTGVSFTANDESFTPRVGEVLSFGFPNLERVRVTAVSGTAPNWTLSLQRGFAGTTKTTHAIGDFLGPMDWMHTDHVHINNKGHAVFAELIYQAFQAMPLPSEYQMAESQGVWSQSSQQISMGIIDNNYLWTPITIISSGAIPTGTQWAVPVFIPKTCIAVELGVSLTATAVNGRCRVGIYLPDGSHCRPGRLLQEMGILDTATGTSDLKTAIGFQILRPGWYWLSGVNQTAAGTTRNYSALGLPWPSIMSSGGLAGVSVLGISQSGITGAMADWGASYTYETAATRIARMVIRLRSPMFA